MAQEKVSIVMPVFNGEKFLEKSILSVLAQTYPNVELIVIDGGSKDGTLEIIRNYQDRLSFWISEPDAGMYDAINKGIKKASGDIIAYLNSDDLYFPDTVSMVVKFFRAHQDAGMAFGNCEFIDAQGNHLYRYRYPKFHWTRFVSLDWMSIPQPTVFWKREVQEKCGLFDPSFKMAGDFDFFSRAGKHFRVSHSGHVLAKFRIHGESLSSTGVERNKGEVLRIRKSLGLKLGPFFSLTRWISEIQIKFLNLPLMIRKASRWND